MTPHEMLVAPFGYMPPPRILDGLTPAQAGRRVQGGTHTIVEIVAHLGFWQSWFLDRITGRPAPMAASAALGWPAAGEDDWHRMRDEFVDGLHRAVALGETPGEGARRVEPSIEFPPLAEYTVADALTHVAIHNAHHLGQIVTIRQMLGAWPPPEGSWTW
jgi:uncharacterized damage-inducible protein DinB